MSGRAGQLCVLVLDMNPNQAYFTQNPTHLLKCLDAVLGFANAHLALNPGNKIAAIAAHSASCCFLYPPPPQDDSDSEFNQRDGQYERFYGMESRIRRKVSEILRSIPSQNSESLLSGALAMALAYINKEKSGSISESRILVVSASGDSASQYMNYMNSFFTAQKLNILIDACMMKAESSLLQQGVDITGGIYFKLTDTDSLLQFLLWLFLPDAKLRTQLGMPSSHKVDYRAACFCHRQMVDVGFVCSVCLSIFCKFSPICTTCHTVFKSPGPLGVGKKKKTNGNISNKMKK